MKSSDQLFFNTGRYNETRRAWNTGREKFGSRITFYAPTLKQYETEEFQQSCGRCYFMPVSITGRECELNCEHCGRLILASMKPTPSPEELYDYARDLSQRGARGMLVSGGADSRGVVPIAPFLRTIGRIREDFQFNIVAHVGVLDEPTVRLMEETGALDGAMIDIVGSNETLREVYHLKETTTDDFERSLELLCRHNIRTIPHVVIGLHFGQIRGEYRALEMIAAHPVAAVVLVGLLPQKGSGMENVEPPSPALMGEIFTRARGLFPNTPVNLGCIRPSGEHKMETDIQALKAGLNGIAYPAEGIVTLARSMGLEADFSEYCCSVLSDIRSAVDLKECVTNTESAPVNSIAKMAKTAEEDVREVDHAR